MVIMLKEVKDRDFSGGTVVKGQGRGQGFKPWSGKITHAAEQLSLCATTAESTWRTTMKSSPHSSQLEKACMQQ